MVKNIGIRVISDTCNVQPHTIRMWEKRYGAFVPDRGQGGQRLYGQEDLARAKAFAILISQGQSISKIANLSLAELNNQVEAINVSSDSTSEEAIIGLGIKRLMKHLASYEIDNVYSEIQYLRMNSSSKEFIFEIVLPVMRQIGELVSKGKYTVTQEHIISTIIRDQLGQIRLPNFSNGKKYVLATPEGNLHELSIIIADILCRANRYATYYLGAANPASCLGEAVSALKCDGIIMGAVSSDHWEYDKNIIPYLQQLDAALDRNIEVILGGGWEIDFPEFKNITTIKVMENFEKFDNEFLANG